MAASGLTPNYSLSYPLGSDPVSISSDMQNLANDVDSVLFLLSELLLAPIGGGTITGELIGTLDTDATSSTTGAFRTAGGMGIAKKLYVGDNLTVTGTVAGSGLAGSLLSSATPSTGGVASAGTSTIPAREDHVHPGSSGSDPDDAQTILANRVFG